ncbi:MAG TPA: hypothetical protein V6C86_24105 [Oculatellaceae cyanobacterium]
MSGTIAGGVSGYGYEVPMNEVPQQASPLLTGGVSGQGGGGAIGGGVTQITSPTQNTNTNTTYNEPLYYTSTQTTQLPNLMQGLQSSGGAVPLQSIQSAPLQFAAPMQFSPLQASGPRMSGSAPVTANIAPLANLPGGAVPGGFSNSGNSVAPNMLHGQAGDTGEASDWGYGGGGAIPNLAMQPPQGYAQSPPELRYQQPMPDYSMGYGGGAPMGYPPTPPMPASYQPPLLGAGNADPYGDAAAYGGGAQPALYQQPSQGYVQRRQPNFYYQQQLNDLQDPQPAMAPNYGRTANQWMNPQHSKAHNFFAGLAAGFSPAIAKQQWEETKARAEVAKTLMQESGLDYREGNRTAEANYNAQLQSRTRMASEELRANAAGQPGPSDGFRAFNQAMQMPIRTPQDLQGQAQLLQFASQTTGMDLTSFLGRTSPQAAMQAQHAYNTLVKDSQDMAIRQNTINNLPTKNAAAQQRLQNSQNTGALLANRVNNIPTTNQIIQNRAINSGNQAAISSNKAQQVQSGTISDKDADRLVRSSQQRQLLDQRLAKAGADSVTGKAAPIDMNKPFLTAPPSAPNATAHVVALYKERYGTKEATAQALRRDGWKGF